MIDLKPYYDAARAADEEVQRIMDEMNAAFLEGTDEGKQRALDLRPALDEAKKSAKDANDLYLSLREAASQGSGAAREFVPVAENLGGQHAKEMKRKEFLALEASARMKYIKAGGLVLDEDEE